MSKKGLIKALINILILAFSSGGLWAGELSDLVNRTNINGDFTVLYQAQDTENDIWSSRDRGIVRLRSGLEFTVNEHWNVGIGFASIGDDPRSKYLTLSDTYDSMNGRRDYLYTQYMHNEIPSFISGKIKNPLYRDSDLFWDRDINSGGIAATINFKPLDNHDLEVFVTPAYFFLDEFANGKNDPSMIVFQPGIIWKIDKTTSLKFAFTYYAFDNLMGSNFTYNNRTTSIDGSGDFIYDYDSMAIDTEFGYYLSEITNNIITDMVPYAAVFGQIISSDAYKDDRGILLGLKLGNEKVEGVGQWQFIYNYRRLEREALFNFLPDTNFYLGETAVKGSEYELKVGIKNNITVGLDYYYSQPLDRNIGKTEYLLQADLVFKF